MLYSRLEVNPLVPSLAARTGGHFACACVNPLNDNSVGASNLMAGIENSRVKLQSFSLVL